MGSCAGFAKLQSRLYLVEMSKRRKSHKTTYRLDMDRSMMKSKSRRSGRLESLCWFAPGDTARAKTTSVLINGQSTAPG